MNDTPELKACPFCGSKGFIDEYCPTGDPETVVFSCSCNGEGCPIAFRDHGTFDRKCDAINAWNTRTDLTRPPSSEQPASGEFQKEIDFLKMIVEKNRYNDGQISKRDFAHFIHEIVGRLERMKSTRQPPEQREWTEDMQHILEWLEGRGFNGGMSEQDCKYLAQVARRALAKNNVVKVK